MVIVGAGECGTRAGLALRDHGWQGGIVLIGEESVPPYERPPLSKPSFSSESIMPPPAAGGAEALKAAEIDFLQGVTATAIDPDARTLATADGRRLNFERLLLATGARPRRLPPPHGDRVHYLRTHSDASVIRAELKPGAHVMIIGAGFLGLELAASASTLGCQATVIELAPRPLMRIVPAGIAQEIMALHRQAGVEVRCGVAVAGLRPAVGGWCVTLDDGSRLDCDAVVAAVGAVPETTLASSAGLAVSDGIEVDASLETSARGVFAAGDCCRFPHHLYDGRRIRLEAWRNAVEQASAVANSMLGKPNCFDAVPSFWSDQFDRTLHIAGLPPAATREVKRRRDDGVTISFGISQDGRLLSAAGIGYRNSAAKDVRLAEKLIQIQARPPVAALSDPSVRLTELL
jgi:3-phenylpropionate/trans-cinnamate dioxygenase ferredoxin reductase subunit